jgi:hypothetical protein
MSLTFVSHGGAPISNARMAAMQAQEAELERQRRLAAKAYSCQCTRVDASLGSSLWEVAWHRLAERTVVRSKPYICKRRPSNAKNWPTRLIGRPEKAVA